MGSRDGGQPEGRFYVLPGRHPGDARGPLWPDHHDRSSVLAKNGGNPRPWIDRTEQEHSDNVAYCAAKAGAHAMTLYLAKELSADNITVNCVAPGPIASAMTLGSARKRSRACCRWGRLGRPEEVADAVTYPGRRTGLLHDRRNPGRERRRLGRLSGPPRHQDSLVTRRPVRQPDRPEDPLRFQVRSESRTRLSLMPGCMSGLRRHARMRHRGGVRHQAFDAAQRLRQCE